jgi:hypothetical protein
MTSARLTRAAMAAAVLAGGCGSASSERGLVASYITRVNRIEAGLARPLGTVGQVAGAFAAERAVRPSPTTEAQQQLLLRDLTQIRAVSRELSTIGAPRPAARLRALLIELADRQATMTHEVAQLVRFLPAFQVALSPLGPATARLERVLLQQRALGSAGVAAVFAAKADGLRQFRATVDRILARLRGLDPARGLEAALQHRA